MYRAKHPAAFINALSDGPKAEVIEWLQRTWDELVDAKSALREAMEWNWLDADVPAEVKARCEQALGENKS